MALVENWMPPSRENWETIVWFFQFFPLVTILQWVQPWYGAGKTSSNSRFNIPGKIAWITMETPGMLTMLYIMYTLPGQVGMAQIPWENKLMAGLYVGHYIYRAVLGPLITPSLSPIHPIVWLAAMAFQITNATSLAGYFGGYGPVTREDWKPKTGNPYVNGARIELGLMLFFLGFLGNMYHDDELREIRRSAMRRQAKEAEEEDPSTGKKKGKANVDKVYMIPQNGLFNFILYPHYFCEWIEWAGYFIIAGPNCVPARTFLLNEVATMLPRAVQGKAWYVKKFGREKVGNKKAVLPGIW
ncbi:steroid 5 alpha-reductase protein [Rutstroemia sp. NJR-2017a BBW]|nr:steroid 5 alpha-reductase protein [Rutstroemia sp. NJR-2017a BBW]